MEARSTGLGLVGGHRLQRRAVGPDGVPPRGAHVVWSAARAVDGRAFGTDIAALAIDAHRGGDDDAAYRPVDQGFQQHRGAQVVGPDIAGDLVHGLADADLGGQVDDAVAALQGGTDAVPVAHVAAHELGPIGQVGRAALVDLLDQRIVEPHVMAALQHLPRDVASDEAATAGHEDPRHVSAARWC